MSYSNDTLVGTAGGTLFSAIMVQTGNVIDTAILAAVGACVSYLVSLCLKRLFEVLRRK